MYTFQWSNRNKTNSDNNRFNWSKLYGISLWRIYYSRKCPNARLEKLINDRKKKNTTQRHPILINTILADIVLYSIHACRKLNTVPKTKLCVWGLCGVWTLCPTFITSYLYSRGSFRDLVWYKIHSNNNRGAVFVWKSIVSRCRRLYPLSILHCVDIVFNPRFVSGRCWFSINRPSFIVRVLWKRELSFCFGLFSYITCVLFNRISD